MRTECYDKSRIMYGGAVAKVLVAVLLIVGNLAWASEGQAGQAAAYLKMGVGARPLGMGSAFVGISDDSTAAFWNPAGLAQLQHREITTMHAALSFDRKYNFANYVTPLPRTGGVIGLSFIRFGVDDINETRIWRLDPTGTPSRGLIFGDPVRLDGRSIPVMEGDSNFGSDYSDNIITTYAEWRTAYGDGGNVEIFGNFQDSETAIFLSYAQRYRHYNNLLLGGNLKYLSHKLHNYKADAFGIDLGVLWISNPKTRIGLSVRDIGSRLSWDTPSGRNDNVPMTTTLGISYQPRTDTLLSMDVNKVQELDVIYRFGAEKWIRDRIGLRVGSDDRRFTAGISFKIPQWNFDYAFKDQVLGDEHRISATRTF